jgi:hypothetical protein
MPGMGSVKIILVGLLVENGLRVGYYLNILIIAPFPYPDDMVLITIKFMRISQMVAFDHFFAISLSITSSMSKFRTTPYHPISLTSPK